RGTDRVLRARYERHTPCVSLSPDRRRAGRSLRQRGTLGAPQRVAALLDWLPAVGYSCRSDSSGSEPMRFTRLVAVSLLGLLAACSEEAGRDSGAAAAELLLVNARVYTLRWDDPAADGTLAAGAP